MIMIREMLICDAITTVLVKVSDDLILNAILISLKSENDNEREEAIETMKIFENKNEIADNKFDETFNLMIDRLKDHIPHIRIAASLIIANLIAKHPQQTIIDEKLSEIVLSIDDESEDIRNAIHDLILSISKSDRLKPNLLDILKKQQNYHPEAEDLCKEIIAALE